MVTRGDSWMNFLTALGTQRDKRTSTFFAPDIVTDTEALHLWRGDDICKRIIEAVPNTAFRRGIMLNVQDKDLAEKIQRGLQKVQLVERFIKAAQNENAYGGGALYPITGDIGDLEEPLDENSIQSVSAFHVLEPRELTPVSYYTDLTDPKFGQPEVWRLIPLNSGVMGMAMTYIHESRLITFPGRRVSRQLQSYQRPGWGDSQLSGVYAIVRDFGSAWGHAAALLQDFSQGVLSMDGYADLMNQKDGEAIVRARLSMLDQMRSTMRMMIVDKGDTFSRQTTPMGGLSDLLHDFALRIAAAAEQPVTVLFGMAPAGLNATGDNDVRGWYDSVEARREHHYRPRLEHAIRLFMLGQDSPCAGVEPEVWSADFPPLWTPTEKEQADTRLAIAQTDKIYAIDIAACTPDDVAESRWKGDTFSAEMVIDWNAREAQKKVEEAMAKEALAQEQAKTEAIKANGGIDPNDPTGGGQPPPVPGGGSGGGAEPPPPAVADPAAPAAETPPEPKPGRQVPVKEHTRTIRSGA